MIFFSKDSFLSVFDKPATKKAKYKKEDSIEADEDTIDREKKDNNLTFFTHYKQVADIGILKNVFTKPVLVLIWPDS